MFHKVKTVAPLKDFNLSVVFLDGTRQNYDVKQLFEYEAFGDLKEIQGLYEQVKVGAGGYGISWNDNIDIACDELWENGKSA